MPNNDIIFSVEDYRGEKVIFTRKKWEQKKNDHPELQKEAFIECLKRAIMKPDEVWEDFGDKRKRCYYKKYSQFTYAKAIVWIRHSPCQVVSAFEIDYIKENNYPNLRKFV